MAKILSINEQFVGGGSLTLDDVQDVASGKPGSPIISLLQRQVTDELERSFAGIIIKGGKSIFTSQTTLHKDLNAFGHISFAGSFAKSDQASADLSTLYSSNDV